MFVKTNAEVRTVTHKKFVEDHVEEKSEESFVYPVGDKILITHLEHQIGGGGTNTATSFSKLGFKTGYLGKIGKDYNGLRIFKYLKENKIDFLGTLGEQSGFSVILDSFAEDRTILTFKGCSNDLKYSEIADEQLDTKWFYISSMMEESLKTTKKILSKTKAKVAFNPSLYLTELGVDNLKEILRVTDLLIFNKEEAQSLAQKESLEDCFKHLKKFVRGHIVITDAGRGAYYFDGKHIYSAKPTPNLKIVETTGAGDAFASALTAAIIRKKSLNQALKQGFIQAESVIQSYGAKTKLLSEKQLSEKVKKDKRKIIKKKI